MLKAQIVRYWVLDLYERDCMYARMLKSFMQEPKSP